ncbi:MAG: ScpA family protein [Patescibacteria group bacterium]|nr:ScpA family protein [Patescibacteria group bacterium]
MNEYKVEIEQFEGPLDLLLQLIEKEELDITKVSLAKVTDDYLQHINNSPAIHPEELADFLVIAAKLILVKSKLLMPNLVFDDDDGLDLETQLKMYREFVEASKKINSMIRSGRWSYGRERLAANEVIGFFPPNDINAGMLCEMFEKIARKLEPFISLPNEALKKTISITEKIEHIRNLISNAVRASFSQVLKSARNKTEVIVSFLALLELIKQRVVQTSQEKIFEDITIQKI